jgi:hypothetical protein
MSTSIRPAAVGRLRVQPFGQVRLRLVLHLPAGPGLALHHLDRHHATMSTSIRLLWPAAVGRLRVQAIGTLRLERTLLGSRGAGNLAGRRRAFLRRTSPECRPEATEQGAPALAGRVRCITACLAQRARLPSRLVRRGAGASLATRRRLAWSWDDPGELPPPPRHRCVRRSWIG